MTGMRAKQGDSLSSRHVWLSLTPETSIAVSYDEAIKWTEADFVTLYKRHVYGAEDSVAETWAERQIEERDAHLENRWPDVERG